MKQELDKIRTKLSKLLRLGESESASQGEIDNALRMANELMARHSLTREDLDHGDETDPTKSMQLGRNQAFSHGRFFTAWQSNLSRFVRDFIGYVDLYVQKGRLLRRNGITLLDRQGNPRKGTIITFYGVADDSEAAVELYEELQEAIATMGTIRYGGFMKGDGGSYCEGFVDGLIAANKRAVHQLKASSSQTNQLMVLTEQNQLALVSRAKTWLLQEHGIKLRKGQHHRGANGSSQARQSGFADGKHYSVNRNSPTKKLT